MNNAKIIIKAKNLELTADLQNFVEEKIGSVAKFISVPAEIFVEVEKQTKHHLKGDVFKSECKIVLPKKTIVAQAHGDDLLKTIVEVKDRLQQEIKNYKFKKIDTNRREQRKFKEKIEN